MGNVTHVTSFLFLGERGLNSKRRSYMSTLKTVILAAALSAAATSMTLGQSGGNNGMPPASYKGPGGMPSYPVAGSTAANAAASGGSGTHQSAQKTGSAANTQKVLGNQNGYPFGGSGMPPASYKGPGAMPSYPVAGRTAARSGRRGQRGLYSYSPGGR